MFRNRTVFLFFFAFFSLCAAPLSASAAGLPQPAGGAEDLLITQANQDRVARGLPPVARDPLLSEAAAFHALEMARHGDISHEFPGEPELSERGARAGVRFSLITENVAEASDPAVIHNLWMHSPGHRANLLDPEVNVVGIAVVVSNHQVYAVEDFASTVDALSFDQQEQTVASLLSRSGIAIKSGRSIDARKTCSMETGYAGARRAWFVMRYTASTLSELPTELASSLGSGRYHEAAVGACASEDQGSFAGYNIAVLLYP